MRAGDSLLLEPRSQYVHEKIPKAEVEELVLEEVPDIAYADIGGLDEQIEREHTVTINGNSVEYTAPGGIRLRFDSKGSGLYGTMEELGPERMRYTFSPSTGAFTIRENNIGCIWSGTLLRQP